MRRRLLLAVTVGPVLLVPAVLGVEVVLALRAPRLADEEGERPVRRTVRPGDDPLHVLWLGDSTSTGVGADDFADSMAFRVAEGLTVEPVVLTVLGRSGDQVHDEQLPALVAGVAPGGELGTVDVVLVSIGANDVTALTRAPTFRSRYRRMVDVIRATVPGAELHLVGIPDMGTAPRLPVPLRQLAGVRAAQLDDVVADVADERGVDYVDLAGPTSGTFSSDPDRYFSGDDFHPSGDGHGVWAAAVLASLEA